ncbi:MAG: ATP-binding protein [Candidatus Desantisbacteria bacterium]
MTDNLKNLGIALKTKSLVYPFLEKREYQGMGVLVKKTGKETKTRITIICPDGVVLADSENDPKLIENQKNKPEIIGAIKNGFGRSVRYSIVSKKNMLFVALPVIREDNRELVGILRVSLFLRDIDILFAKLQIKILRISIVIIILSLLGALLFSRNLLKPIQRLKIASQKVTGGDFNVRVILKSNDELKDLAESFNRMTEQMKETFEKLSQQNEELRNAERIKRDFVTNVSHELRTPLTAIKGFAETLEDEVDPKSRRHVDIIRVHTDRLITIVQDLLVLSELEGKESNLEFEDVNIVELLENVTNLFTEKIIEKRLELKFVIDENIPHLRANSFKLEQMLINLIDNAVKYTEKGEITISIKQMPGGLPQNEFVVFEIMDTGIGISEKHLIRIFERFFVVNRSRSRKLGGTGLGLSIIKHIVQLHNGKIIVESTPDTGSKFIVILPINPHLI